MKELTKKENKKRLNGLALSLLDWCGGELNLKDAEKFYLLYKVDKAERALLYSTAEQLLR